MAKEKLHEEQEHMEMAKMENDIKWLNEKGWWWLNLNLTKQ